MPLVRFEVRNAYGLGDPELYKGAAKREDPKALLDGVAVAGLVGILRQLGDLAEFAAEIFHDLHEQVTATAARGRRMMARIHHIEEALPTIEKAVQNQKSHIHFAYVAGSEWHSNVQIEHDHLRHTDLPRFIMDSYEECRDPPRLYLLDKFDSAGPGSGACLRRYSDPTYFKRVCASLEPVKAEKVPKLRKIRKSKKKLSRLKDVDIQHVISLSHHGSSMQCTSPGTDGQSITAETLSASDMRLKSELGSRSTSFDSRTRLSFMDPALGRNSSIETENQDYNVSSASILKDSDIHACATATAANGDVENLEADDDFYNNYLEMQSGLGTPSAAWDEKIEIVKPMPKSKFLVEPVLDVSYPLASEQPECSEVSAQLNDSHSNLGGAGKPEESNVEGPDEVDDDDGSRQDSLLEQHTPSSSSVTWDEKAEIIRTTGPQMPGSDLAATQDSDSHSFIPEACKQDTETSMPGEIDKGDVLYSVTNMQAEFPVDNPIDEVISETENYVDALNTLESETETDTEFQTKRELMPPPKSCCQGMEFTTDNMQNVGAPSCESSDSESSIMSNTSLDKDEPSQSSTMICSGSSASVQANDNGHSGCSIDNGYEKLNDDASRLSTVEDAAADLSCNSKVPSSQEVLDTGIPTTERQEVQVPKGCDGPIQFWTNGGLLGLEPSKPPDFSVANVVRENSVPNSHVNNYDTLKVGYDTSSLKSETIVLSNEIKSTSGGKESTSSRPEVIVGGTSNLVYPTEPSGSFYHNGKNDGRPTSKSQDSVPVLSKPELGKFRETHPSNILANGTGHELRKANGHCGDDSLISLNDAASSGQHGPPKIGVSSSLTNLTRRLLMNSLQRKEALTHSDTSASPGIAYTDSTNLQNISIPNFETNKLNDSTNLQNISIPNFETNKLNGSASQESLEPNALEKADFSSEGNTFSSMLHCSGQSSPPLEHMKISFHPMNGLETNKLKLEFPDSHLHENVEELMFPSFQLLPGSNIPLQGICSESDDDTFCRSYPYSPEDACSPHSDSNSELWAQDEMSESENHEIHDDSRRFSSSTASVSSSLETEGRKHIGIDQESTSENLERENGTTAFRSGTFLDLPNVDSLTLSLTHRLGECDPVSNKSLHRTLSSSGSQPPPPPLPPLQWRTTRTPIPVDDNGLSSNEIKHLDGPELPRSLALHPSAWEVLRPLHVGEIGPDKSTLSGHKDLKKAPQGGEHDEREDLLHQIRNKTFNLRRTVTSRPSLVPRSTTNVKVAAILEKANAIRQAFASSDEGGDDETWSDG